LGKFDLEFGPPLFQRAIENVISRIKPAGFVRLKLIDIAVLENAGRERQLLGGMVGPAACISRTRSDHSE
jgi:hypothetical protein